MQTGLYTTGLQCRQVSTQRVYSVVWSLHNGFTVQSVWCVHVLCTTVEFGVLSHRTLTGRLKQDYFLLRHADKERLLLVPDLLVVSTLVILEEGNHALLGLKGGSGVSVPVNVINPVGLVVVPVDKVHST